MMITANDSAAKIAGLLATNLFIYPITPSTGASEAVSALAKTV